MHIRIARLDAEVLRIWLARALARGKCVFDMYTVVRGGIIVIKIVSQPSGFELPKFIWRTRPRDFPGSSIIPSKSRTFCQTPTLMVAEQLDSSQLKPAGCV